MNRHFSRFTFAALLAAGLLAGCAAPGPSPVVAAAPAPEPAKPVAAAPAPPAPLPPSAEQLALKEGIAAYNNGDYNEAIKRLASADIWNGGTKAGQLDALKYTAFSYCVTNRPAQCRQQFDKALKLDPAFDLAPGEHGHPLWGPVFMRARKGK